MPGLSDFLIDRNGDGFLDDATARFIVDPASPDATFWSELIDLAALIGLQCQALPLPLFLPAGTQAADDGIRLIPLRTRDDLRQLRWGWPEPEGGSPGGAPAAPRRSTDLLDLFTISGMLNDDDGDLVADATAVGFEIPEHLPVSAGTALVNLAVRIGLESGGVRLPLVGRAERMLRVRPGEGSAELRAAPEGWTVTGESESVAALLNEISRQWPYFGSPDTAGARYGVEALGRALAGDLPRAPEPGSVVWELQWSAEPEVTRILRAVESRLLPRVSPGESPTVIVFACEPPAERKRLARDIEKLLGDAGAESPAVTVLSAFKVGLSWLREVVLPSLADQSVDRLRIEYRRFEPEGGGHLDLPIRWMQELFPGNEIAAEALGLPLEAIEIVESSGADAPIYRAEAIDSSGARLGAWECDLLSYAMPFLPNVPGDEMVQVTTGGFIARLGDEPLHVAVDTDLDRFWRFWQGEALRRVVSHIRESGGFVAGRQPYFGALEVEVWLSAPNEQLGVREENDSAAEALHEDIYFSALDTIEVLGLNETGEKISAPGPVIPVVHVQRGVTPHAVVRLRAAPKPRRQPVPLSVTAVRLVDGEVQPVIEPGEAAGMPDAERVGKLSAALVDGKPSVAATLLIDGRELAIRIPLPVAPGADRQESRPPMDRNIHGDDMMDWAARLAQSDGVAAWVEDYSYQGRAIVGMSVRSPAPGRVWSPAKLAALKPTALIVARHHANEISSTNAAFQLAWLCAHDPAWQELARALNVVLLPYENADGAALHARLAAVAGAESWKHHPARYNALGHEYSEAFHDDHPPYGESRARPALWRRWLPDVLVDNHGVPSHEWVQSFAGFGSPPRFRVSYWIPQALIYGIVRHVDDSELPAHAGMALALRDAVSAAVRDTDLGDLNREIGASYRFWGQDREPERFPGEFHDDMLWHLSSAPADPEGRGFNIRYPRTTVLSWVTEVNDETATGEHLETVARAHLLANRAMLDLMVETGARPIRTAINDEGGTLYRFMRPRPLRPPSSE